MLPQGVGCSADARGDGVGQGAVVHHHPVDLAVGHEGGIAQIVAQTRRRG